MSYGRLILSAQGAHLVERGSQVSSPTISESHPSTLQVGNIVQLTLVYISSMQVRQNGCNTCLDVIISHLLAGFSVYRNATQYCPPEIKIILGCLGLALCK